MSNWRTNTNLFYGWWMAAALFIVQFNLVGMGIYVLPVFIGPFQNEFGWSMTQISIGAALWSVVFGFFSPVVGVLIERFGALKTMLGFAVLTSLTFLAYSKVQSLWMLYAIAAVSGIAVAGTTIVPTTTLITNWFDKYRGRAMALTMIGNGAGGFLTPQIYEFLIRQMGWRQAWLFAFVVLWGIFIPLMALFIRTRPSDVGLLPDGAKPERMEEKEAGIAMSGLTTKKAVKTSSFWLLFLIFLLIVTGPGALTFHFVVFVEKQLQFTSQQAAFYYGLAIGFSMVGRFVFGWLVDKWKPTYLLAAAAFLMACGPAVIEFFIIRIGMRDAGLLWLYAIPYGIGMGGNVVVLPVIISRCFGELHFPKINGLIMSGYALGILLGIPTAGKIFDKTGSYELVFVACVVGLTMATVLSLFIDTDRYKTEFETEEL